LSETPSQEGDEKDEIEKGASKMSQLLQGHQRPTRLTIDVTGLTPALPLHLVWKPNPSFIKPNLELSEVILLALTDGSFLSSDLNSVKRWKLTNQRTIEAIGAYTQLGYLGLGLDSVIELDENTIVTGHRNEIQLWNKTTCECLRTVITDSTVSMLLKLKNGSDLLCGLTNGSVEVRRLHDFKRVDSFELSYVACELEDGTLIVAGYEMMRWDMTKRAVIRTYYGHKGCVLRVIELKSDIIIGLSSVYPLVMWRVSTGECLLILTETDCERVYNIAKLKEGFFATCGTDRCIRVWDEYGNNVATYKSPCNINSMAILADGSLATHCCSCRTIQIRMP